MPREGHPPYFPFYPDDFASDGDVEAMSPAQVGAYILLLCKAWREDPVGSVPDDDRLLARWARMTPDEWSEAKSAVLVPFQLRADFRWHQPRMQREYMKFRESSRRKSELGARAANKRWGKHQKDASAMPTQCIGNADALQTQCLSYSSSVSDSEVKKETSIEVSSAQSRDGPASPDEPVMVFPCSGTPKSWGLPASKVDEWAEAYPGIDALAECRKALQWCRDNPTRIKTASGMTRFLSSWLSKAQNTSHGRVAAEKPLSSRLPTDEDLKNYTPY